MKILLAVDGSPYSDEAVKEVARRPWPEHSKVRVISVVEPPVPPPPEVWPIGVDPEAIAGTDEWLRKRAREAVAEAARMLEEGVDKTLQITREVLTGSPRQAILFESEAWLADLIVVGSHGYGFWERVVLGSVSQAVATHAQCSVEIVKRRKIDGTASERKGQEPSV
jgi:nucleotide-binding universal stress UspA family protein